MFYTSDISGLKLSWETPVFYFKNYYNRLVTTSENVTGIIYILPKFSKFGNIIMVLLMFVQYWSTPAIFGILILLNTLMVLKTSNVNSPNAYLPYAICLIRNA